MQGMLKKAAISCAAAAALLAASNASAQAYNEFTSGVFTFRAYQPEIVNGKIEVVGTATTSANQGTNWCTYLYQGLVAVKGMCSAVSSSNTPDVITLDTNCSSTPGVTVVYKTLVKRVIAGGGGVVGGAPQQIWSAPLSVRPPACN